MLRLAPISLKEANQYVREVHRHHDPVVGHKFSVSVVDENGDVHGVGIAGRPVSRHLQAEGYLEVLRVATDGSRNACSMIYGALRRAGVALGYEPSKIITYTLAEEDGASLRASGWVFAGTSAGGSWNSPSRPRTDHHPTGAKLRWLAGGD
jgi:hypothetical protein